MMCIEHIMLHTITYRLEEKGVSRWLASLFLNSFYFKYLFMSKFSPFHWLGGYIESLYGLGNTSLGWVYVCVHKIKYFNSSLQGTCRSQLGQYTICYCPANPVGNAATDRPLYNVQKIDKTTNKRCQRLFIPTITALVELIHDIKAAFNKELPEIYIYVMAFQNYFCINVIFKTA